MALGDTYEVSGELAPNGELVVDAGPAQTGAAEVFDFYGTGPARVLREFTVSTAFDSSTLVVENTGTGDWLSTENNFIVSAGEQTRLRIVNIGIEPARFHAVGQEVSD